MMALIMSGSSSCRRPSRVLEPGSDHAGSHTVLIIPARSIVRACSVIPARTAHRGGGTC